MTRALIRLGVAGVCGQPLASAVVILVVALCAATATLALGLRQASERPWQRAFVASNGPHLSVFSHTPADLAPLARAAGVADTSGPFATAETELSARSGRYPLRLVGMSTTPPRVGRPQLLEGRWLTGRDGIVLDQAFARRTQITTGDTVQIGGNGAGRPLTVVGIAVATIQPPFPNSQPALVFVTRDTLDLVVPDPAGRGALLELRLTDPPGAPAAAESIAANSAGPPLATYTWQEIRDAATSDNADIVAVLSTLTVLLLLAAAAILATTIGTRAQARQQELGLVRAVGVTPGQIAGLLAGETLLLGLIGTAVGIGVGIAATPLVTRPGADLLGAPAPRATSAISVLLVLLAVEVCVVLATTRAATRAARSTALAATTPERPRTSASSLAGLIERSKLPAWLVLAARDSLINWRSLTPVVVSSTLAVTVAITALGMEASFAASDRLPARFERPAGTALPTIPPQGVLPGTDSNGEIRTIVYTLGAILVALALVHLAASGSLEASRRRRELALLKAVGLTPSELTALAASRALAPAAIAAVLGVPAGLVLFQLVARTRNVAVVATPAPALILATIALTLLAAAAANWLPARRAAHHPARNALTHT